MKFNSYFLLAVLFSLYIQIAKAYDDMLDEKLAKKILGELNIKNNGSIPREAFKEYFFRILTKDQPDTHPHARLFKKVTEKLAQTLPEIIEISQLSYHTRKESVISILEEVVAEEYGQEYVKGLKEEVDKIENQQKLKDQKEAHKVIKQKPVQNNEPTKSTLQEVHTEL